MVFINLKIRVTLIHNSLNWRNRDIVSLSNRCKRNIFLKPKRNSILKIIRYVRIIANNISRRRKSFLTILTNISLYSKFKFNIVVLNRNIPNFTIFWTIFNNIFRIAMRIRIIIRFKKTFKNFNYIITFLNNLTIIFFWKRNNI